jgi:hypothetical protein
LLPGLNVLRERRVVDWICRREASNSFLTVLLTRNQLEPGEAGPRAKSLNTNVRTASIAVTVPRCPRATSAGFVTSADDALEALH